MFEIVVLSLFNSLGDRLRGGLIPRDKRIISAQIYGLLIFTSIMWYLLDPSWYTTVAIAVSYYIGESFGWGGPLGNYLRGNLDRGKIHDWQVGILKIRMDLALIVRGLMWGLPIGLVLGFVDVSLGLVTVFAYTVSMLAAPATAKALWPSHDPWGLWQRQEWVRGFYVMSMIASYIHFSY